MIEVGFQVRVNFNNAQYTLASDAQPLTVIYMPRATGDSWIFEDSKGCTHYVSEGCTVSTYPPEQALEKDG